MGERLSGSGNDPLVKLAQVEEKLRKITEVIDNLGTSSSSSQYDLTRYNPNDPSQAEKYLRTAVKLGRMVRLLTQTVKPSFEAEASALKQEISRRANIADELYEELRELGEEGYLDESIIGQGVTAFTSLKDTLSEWIQPDEIIIDSELEVSGVAFALLAVNVAEAYVLQNGEDVFSLNTNFFQFFGRLASSLPRDTSEMDSYLLLRVKRKIIKRAMSGNLALNEFDNEDSRIRLMEWIEANARDKDKFYRLLLTVDDVLHINPEVDTRRHFIKVLKESNRKFFSLHPEIQEEENRERRERWENAERQAKFAREAEKKKQAKEAPKEGEKRREAKGAEEVGEEETSVDDEVLGFLVNNIGESVIREQLPEAEERAIRAGFIFGDTLKDRIVALYNLHHYNEKGDNLTTSAVKGVKRKLNNLLKRNKEVPSTKPQVTDTENPHNNE